MTHVWSTEVYDPENKCMKRVVVSEQTHAFLDELWPVAAKGAFSATRLFVNGRVYIKEEATP